MKKRLDVILVDRGLAASRERAKSVILSGNVYVDGRKAEKAGSFFEEDVPLKVQGEPLRYVSRGGLKLEKAIKCWELDLTGRICLDIGASTGGFTDCMLRNGAAKVYAVDAGRGQLSDKLRADERVVCMEQCNFRYMTGKEMTQEPDFAGADVSFISLTKILLPAREILRAGGRIVGLVKPQFEAGRENVGKRGVVRNPKIHAQVLGRIIDFADSIGFVVLDVEYSPIRGPEGNIEYLILLEKPLRQEELPVVFQEEAFLCQPGEAGGGLSRDRKWSERIWETVEKAGKSI